MTDILIFEEFVEDYESVKESISFIKHELASEEE